MCEIILEYSKYFIALERSAGQFVKVKLSFQELRFFFSGLVAVTQ